MIRWWILAFPILSLASPIENLGSISVSELLLRPNVTFGSPGIGQRGFNIGESSVSFLWSLDEQLSGHVRVGPRTLINPPAHYSSQSKPDLDAVEAYAEFNHAYGRFRLGRVPLDFGIEGAKSESELIFPRSFVFSDRIVGLRDNGISYAIDYNNFFTEFVVHDGEGTFDQDDQYWLTSRWGYKFERAIVGLAGQTGKTTPDSTATSSESLASVDVTKPAKWRMIGLFANWNPHHIYLELEAYGGERDQEHDVHDFMTGHFDVGYEFTDDFSLFARYDAKNPDTRVDNDAVHQVDLAFVFTNATRTSRVILVGGHNFNEGHIGDDQIKLIWSLSPKPMPSLF